MQELPPIPLPSARALVTPFYLHLANDQSLPADPVYYLEAQNGLFLGRNDRDGLFQTLAPAQNGPGELAFAQSRIILRLPKVSPTLLATIMAFFTHIGRRWQAEAIVLLYLAADRRTLMPVVPAQRSVVDHVPGYRPYPIGVHYQLPRDLDPTWRLLGSIHCHVYESVHPSGTDIADEAHGRQGLHVVVNLHPSPLPPVHAVFVIDGTRFRIRPEEVFDFETYAGPAAGFPAAWLKAVEIKEYVPPKSAVLPPPRGLTGEEGCPPPR